ncbi:FKBP-type peptidyl-prolyl cis-trans isomerase N-terminal domain-containing protein, partial [Enterobacter ludwigii]|uniref:FKBP-type peptidyl-prolyl cis-trans isomerase N-terminal domain-containing protein n=1 Tax=Enterobacter ludwigii TaxID=299767 RepID=UPI003F6EF677
MRIRTECAGLRCVRRMMGCALVWMLMVPVVPVRADTPVSPAESGADSMSVEQQLNTLRAQLEQQKVLLQSLQGGQPGAALPASAAGGQPASSGTVAGTPAHPVTPEGAAVTTDTVAAPPQTLATVIPPPAPPAPAPAQAAPATEQNTVVAPAPVPVPAPAAQDIAAPVAVAQPAAAPAPVPAQVVSPASPVPAVPLPDDENARRAYASGVSLAYEMQQSLAVQKSLGISLPPDLLMAGLQDAFAHHPLRMQDADIQARLSALNTDFTARMQEQRADEVARGRDYRAAFRKQKGVVSDAGALYLITDKGSTPRLHTTDMATLLVTGRLPDGSLFDRSGETGQTRRVKVGAML